MVAQADKYLGFQYSVAVNFFELTQSGPKVGQVCRGWAGQAAMGAMKLGGQDAHPAAPASVAAPTDGPWLGRLLVGASPDRDDFGQKHPDAVPNDRDEE
jgi:hypothetical protein